MTAVAGVEKRLIDTGVGAFDVAEKAGRTWRDIRAGGASTVIPAMARLGIGPSDKVGIRWEGATAPLLLT